MDKHAEKPSTDDRELLKDIHGSTQYYVRHVVGGWEVGITSGDFSMNVLFADGYYPTRTEAIAALWVHFAKCERRKRPLSGRILARLHGLRG